MREFHTTLNALRRAAGISQRKAAADLGISQALLSHYENGAREPGLAFVIRVCRYYGVTADYLLGLNEDPTAGRLPRQDLASLVHALEHLAAESRELLTAQQEAADADGMTEKGHESNG